MVLCRFADGRIVSLELVINFAGGGAFSDVPIKPPRLRNQTRFATAFRAPRAFGGSRDLRGG
jgi:hypothetical protein